ncbi:MAG: cbb3-type cytochrome c oxidase N-terminal domain-containing protein [Verrucomicrobiota bacterium]
MSEDSNKPEIKRGDFARKKGEIILREHEYDGIQEFDQRLPNWWLFTFYGAIIWLVVYWLLYNNTELFNTDQENITKEIAAIHAKKEAELAEAMKTITDEALINEWATDTAKVASGKAIYITNCVACHAADLSATMVAGDQSFPLPGLALNDGEWKYSAKPTEIFKLINDGSPADSTGHNGVKMQPWGQMLTPIQIAEVTAYLIAENPKDFGL